MFFERKLITLLEEVGFWYQFVLILLFLLINVISKKLILLFFSISYVNKKTKLMIVSNLEFFVKIFYIYIYYFFLMNKWYKWYNFQKYIHNHMFNWNNYLHSWNNMLLLSAVTVTYQHKEFPHYMLCVLISQEWVYKFRYFCSKKLKTVSKSVNCVLNSSRML